MTRTVAETAARLSNQKSELLRAPRYCVERMPEFALPQRIAFAVSSMKDHMTDEGWQIMDGLRANGWLLAGHGLPCDETIVPMILKQLDPGVVLVQDKREWDLIRNDFRDPKAYFMDSCVLSEREDIFRLTILKDAHQRPDYHREAAQEIGCHAWVIYYHPTIVKRLAPYVREQHLIRTYHTVDSSLVPPYTSEGRAGCLLSGAMGRNVYPLREAIRAGLGRMPHIKYLPHPGYHREGCMTPEFLKTLSQFKVAICTSSIYGYCLRKIIEATACGCVVLTDLPVDEVLPHIDGNLVRIDPNLGVRTIGRLVVDLIQQYNPERQRAFAQAACAWYDYRSMTQRLAADIEMMRRNYSA